MIPEDLDEKIKLLKSQVIYTMFTLHYTNRECFALQRIYMVSTDSLSLFPGCGAIYC